jgi:hypothetical protein
LEILPYLRFNLQKASPSDVYSILRKICEKKYYFVLKYLIDQHILHPITIRYHTSGLCYYSLTEAVYNRKESISSKINKPLSILGLLIKNGMDLRSQVYDDKNVYQYLNGIIEKRHSKSWIKANGKYAQYYRDHQFVDIPTLEAMKSLVHQELVRYTFDVFIEIALELAPRWPVLVVMEIFQYLLRPEPEDYAGRWAQYWKICKMIKDRYQELN